MLGTAGPDGLPPRGEQRPPSCRPRDQRRRHQDGSGAAVRGSPGRMRQRQRTRRPRGDSCVASISRWARCGCPVLAYHADQGDAALERGRDPLADGGLRLEAVRRKHDQAVRHGRQAGEPARREIEQQQRALHAEPAVQLLPPLVSEQLTRMRRVRARSDEKDVVDLVSRLRQRHAVFERVDDAFGRREPNHLVQRGVFDPQIDERHAAPVQRRRARHVPGSRRGPPEVAGGGHEGHQRLPIDERRDQIVETRARERSCAHGVGW